MTIFCVLYLQRAARSTFQTCILNSHLGHIMCRSMVDIQSATAEIRRGKNIVRTKDRKIETTGQNIMFASATQGGHRPEAEESYEMRDETRDEIGFINVHPKADGQPV